MIYPLHTGVGPLLLRVWGCVVRGFGEHDAPEEEKRLKAMEMEEKAGRSIPENGGSSPGLWMRRLCGSMIRLVRYYQK